MNSKSPLYLIDDNAGLSPSESVSWPSFHQVESPDCPVSSETKDHFVQCDGKEFAGKHLIFDFWGAKHLDDIELMERVMRESVEAAGATLLHIHLHRFTPSGGISGVAVLAESHISVHTWPERGYAAFDVFMCGDAQPEETLPVLRAAFAAEECIVKTLHRGVVQEQGD